MNQVKIGKFTSELRKMKGMTQIEFAEKLGVTNIKPSIKFSFIPISALLFILGSFLYFEDAVFDYGLPYAAIIAIFQFIIILVCEGIRKLIQMIKSKK
ncbi:MAG: hypothetical protein ACI4IL_00175 [Eubacterium sp.]